MVNRLNSLDFLRGLTVIFMIQFHILIFWFIPIHGIFQNIIRFFGKNAPPFFLLISGISITFFVNTRLQNKISKIKIINEVLKRGFLIFIISTIIKFLFGRLLHLEFKLIYWSIFQVIAVSMIAFSPILFLKKSKLFFILFLIIFTFWINYVIKVFNINQFNILIEGSFQNKRRCNLFLFGLIIGIIFNSFKEEQYKEKLIIFLIIALNIFLLWLFLIINLEFLDNYQDLSLILYTTALFLILFSLSYILLDVKKIENNLINIIIRWGKLALSIYYIHFGIITNGVILFPIVFNENFPLNFIFFYFLIIVLIFLICLELFLKLWKKYNYILGFEWLVNKISKKSLFSEIDKNN